MFILEAIKSFHWAKQQDYIPPWVALNQPHILLFLQYYACGVLTVLILAFLYSTYGNYCSVCRDTPVPKTTHFGPSTNTLRGQGSVRPVQRQNRHKRYAGYTVHEDLDLQAIPSP